MLDPRIMKKILRAFEKKDIETVSGLICHEYVSPNDVIPSKGITLLHLIIGHQSENFAFKTTKLFLRCGGDPNVQSADGVTPTHVAAAWGRTRILHLLLVNGGDPWLQDDEKKNVFNYAFEERKWDAIEMLHRFQQMYSAANSREIDPIPKYQMNLERVLLRKGDETFAYEPVKKSMTTQTESDTPSEVPSSPVQDKIKYFEPSKSAGADVNCWRKPEKTANIGWVKDFYQTSCEVMVHCENVKDSEEKKEETFVSSVCIETSPPRSESGVPKSPDIRSLGDVRGQLFVELKEAVRRRSKLLVEPAVPMNPSSLSDSIVVLNGGTAPLAPKEVSSFNGVDSSVGVGMLKNMSDFATKVMNEIEARGGTGEPERTVDLCVSSSPDASNPYLSCEEERKRRKSDVRHVRTLPLLENNSEASNMYQTPYNSNVSSDAVNSKSQENSNESFVSASEEYKYTDVQEGVMLLEKKLLVTPTISIASEDEDIIIGSEEENSTKSSLPSGISLNSDVLRCELKSLGYNPGPVTKTTKKLYLKKLRRLKKMEVRKKTQEKIEPENYVTVLSPVLEKTLSSRERFEKITSYQCLEEEMCRSFENWTKRKWREGTNKTSFNYLLLDPRISSNLPKRASVLTDLETWKSFLSAVFYVGKGKRSRPYAHLYQAVGCWEKREGNLDEKTERIIQIWKQGMGVVCLQVFQNIIPVEAFTREAAMIDALGLPSLKNVRTGEYYGVASTWSTRDKINLGIYLLHKSMLIFLNEGERQIKPYDID